MECSDLSREFCINFGFTKKCRTVGFKDNCNSIVDAFKITWDKARVAAVKVVNDVKDAAIAVKQQALNTANNLKKTAQEALADIRKDLASIGDKIKCAASLGTGN